MTTSRNDDWRDCHECGKAYSLRQRNGKMVCIFCHPNEQINAGSRPVGEPEHATDSANTAVAAPTLEDMLT